MYLLLKICLYFIVDIIIYDLKLLNYWQNSVLNSTCDNSPSNNLVQSIGHTFTKLWFTLPRWNLDELFTMSFQPHDCTTTHILRPKHYHQMKWMADVIFFCPLGQNYPYGSKLPQLSVIKMMGGIFSIFFLYFTD